MDLELTDEQRMLVESIDELVAGAAGELWASLSSSARSTPSRSAPSSSH